LSSILIIPLFQQLIPSGLEYGTNLLVEFEPHSIWYETSLTATAQALRSAYKTDYYVLQHTPNEVRKALGGLGLDVRKLEDDDTFRIIDSYSAQVGLAQPEEAERSVFRQSLKLSDWSIEYARMIKTDLYPEQNGRLHIDDNTAILLQYNDEKMFIDLWRTRHIPMVRARELILFHSVVTEIASNAFYKQFESLCDGIVDVKSEERQGQMQHYLRVRTLRGKPIDSRWRRLQLMKNGEVAIAN
jgi:KaiC/GvpD/RAD55 family RecA-like ATPase